MNRIQATRSLTAKLFNANLRARLVKPALAAVAFLAVSLLGGNAQANDNWVGPTSGNASDTSNWSAGSPNGQQITFASFGGGAYQNLSTYSVTNDLTSATFGGIFLSGPTNVTFTGNDFILNGSGGNPLQINSTGTLTINPNITLTDSSDAFITTGGGAEAIVLNGNVTGTNTTVTSATSSTAGTITFSNDTVQLGGLTSGGNTGFGGNLSSNPYMFFNNSTLTVGGNVSVGRGNLVFEGTTTANITGNIVNYDSWGLLEIEGSANVTAANVAMGSDTPQTGEVVLNGGTLTTGSIAAVERSTGGTESLLVFNGTQINSSASSTSFISVTPDPHDTPTTNEAYIGVNGLLVNTAGFNDTITSKLNDLTTTQTSATSLSGILSSSAAGPGSLTKSGAGTLTLGAANTFSGGVTVTGGTLATSIAGALGSTTNSLSVSGGSVLDLENTTQTVGTTSLGASTIQSTGGAGTLNTGVVTVTGASAISSGATVATGANAVNINSGGTLTLNGASSLTTTGTVTVNSGGSLVFGASSAISSGATVQGAGGTITMAGTTQTIGVLTLLASSGTTTLDLTGGGQLTASDSAGALSPGGATLDINDWQGTSTGGNAGYAVSLGSLNSMDLADVDWSNVDYNGTVYGTLTGAQIVGGQLTPLSMAPVPEPSTVFGALCLLGLIGWRKRRQIGEALQGARLNCA